MLCAQLKRRVMGLAIVERARKNQASRITNSKEGDANTKKISSKSKCKKEKSHPEKEQLIYDHFSSIMDAPQARSKDFNWERLNILVVDVSSLGSTITEDDVLKAIMEMPSDKVPGPNGFTGAFFKS